MAHERSGIAPAMFVVWSDFPENFIEETRPTSQMDEDGEAAFEFLQELVADVMPVPARAAGAAREESIIPPVLAPKSYWSLSIPMSWSSSMRRLRRCGEARPPMDIAGATSSFIRPPAKCVAERPHNSQ